METHQLLNLLRRFFLKIGFLTSNIQKTLNVSGSFLKETLHNIKHGLTKDTARFVKVTEDSGWEGTARWVRTSLNGSRSFKVSAERDRRRRGRGNCEGP